MKRRWPAVKIESIHVYAGIGLLVAILAIVLITGIAALRQNQQSLATQQAIARYEAADEFEYLRGQTRLMIYWQDAFEKMVRQWDPAWVAYQFGPYQDTMGNRLVAIIDPQNHIRLLHATGYEKSFTAANLHRARGLDALLRVVRKFGVRQPPPIPEGVIVVDGHPYFAVAALVTPEEKKDMPLAHSRPFSVLFLKPVAPAVFESLVTGFYAGHLRVGSETTHAPGDASYVLKDAEGHPVAAVTWKLRLPGDDFLQSVTLPLAAVLLLLAAIQTAVVLRWLRLQQRLIRAESESRAAREQSRLKSVFLGTISHELRTPLNAIIGYSDVLCCQIFGSLGSPRNAEYVRDIRDSGRKLLACVNDLIEIARIEAGDTGSGEDLFDPTAAARHAVAHLRKRADEKEVNLVLTIAEETGMCRGSLVSLSQSIERLLDNALRHSHRGGTVTVDVRSAESQTVIEIRDQGEGIPQNRLADLARPFAHGNNYFVASGYKGMGFGIPIARGLVELMGGTFEITSEPEVGTTVRLKLPSQPRQGEPAPEEEHPEPAASSGVIWTGSGRAFAARTMSKGG